MTRFPPSTVSRATGITHQIPKPWLGKLDPEWVEMWNAHGGRHRQAEEVGIEEVRMNPAAYSFTYPTWTGKSKSSSAADILAEVQQDPKFIRRMSLTYR